MRAIQRHPRLELTQDWLAAMETEPAPDYELPPAVQRPYARDDLDGIRRANVLWLLAPTAGHATRGAWVELGFAIALVPYIVVSRGVDHGVRGLPALFESMAQEIHETDLKAFDSIVRLSEEL